MKTVLADLKKSLTELVGDALVRLDLFGSRARGDQSKDSDIDIAIVVRGLDKDLRDRIYTAVAEIELRHLRPLSTIVFSEEDFSRLLRRERRIAMDILAEGRAI